MPYINGTDRDQLSLLPASLEERVAPDSDVRILDTFVSGMPLRALGFTRTGTESADGAGPPEYHANMLLRLLLYGYYFHMQSSRTLAWLCQTNVEVQWLTGDLRPSHATICTFVRENSNGVRELFRRFVLFVKAADLADGALVAVDGTKIKANASRDMVSARSTARAIARADAEIKAINAYIEKLQTEDHDDDPPPGGLHARVQALGGMEAMRERIATLENRKAEQAALQQRVAESTVPYLAPSDPDARLMRTRQGKVPGYNYQVAVDSKHHFIVDEELVQDQNDIQQLEPRTKAVVASLGEVKALLFDNGYESGSQIVAVETMTTAEEGTAPRVYVNLRRTEGKNEVGFVYDAEHDLYRCSQNRELVLEARNKGRGDVIYNIYRSRSCDGCSIRSACTTSKYGRAIKRNIHAEVLDRHRARVRSPEGIALLKRRKTIVEHVPGTLKAILGPSFRTRGKPRVATEARLAAITYNLKRLVNMWTENIAAQFRTFTLQMT